MASPLRNFIYRQAEPAAARLTPGILPTAIPPSVQDPGPPPDPTAHEYVDRPTTGGEKALAAILPILGALQGIQPRNPNTGRRGFDVGAAAQGIAGGLTAGLGNIHERKMQEHKAWWDQQQADQEAAFKTAAMGLQAERNQAMENRNTTPQPQGPPPPPTIEEHRTPSGGILTLVNGKPVTPYREKPTPAPHAPKPGKPIGGIVNVQADIDKAQKELDSLLMRKANGNEAVAARSRRIFELRQKLAELRGTTNAAAAPSSAGVEAASTILKGTAFDQAIQ